MGTQSQLTDEGLLNNQEPFTNPDNEDLLDETGVEQEPVLSIDEQMTQLSEKGIHVENNPFQVGKAVVADFNDPNIQNQFYERYASHGDFDELGFNPFRDNETLYNEEGSALGDFSRAAGQWATLVPLGFKDVAGFGDLADQEVAEEYEKAMAIGSSSRGGASGFMTNLFLNSGYTVGIMAELAAEELAMSLGQLAIGVSGADLVGVGEAGHVGLAGVQGTRWARAMLKIKKATQVGAKMKKAMTVLKDAKKLKRVLNATGKRAGKFLNPLENTTAAFKGIEGTEGFFKTIGKLASSTKGYGALYRDVRTIRMAYSEGALEGGMVTNELEREMIADYKKKHNGEVPSKEIIDKIRAQALEKGHLTALWNMPLIYFSDKLMFDGLIKKNKFKNLASAVIEGEGGKMTFNPKAAAGEWYKRLSENYFERQWQIARDPKLILNKAGKYSAANFTEGFQELGQDIISGTVKEKALNDYKGDSVRGGYYDYFLDNSKKMISMQGIETFASGFLMGGMVGPISNVMGAIQTSPTQYNSTWAGKATQKTRESILKHKDRAQYDEFMLKKKKAEADRKTKFEQDVEVLNEFYENKDMYLSADFINMVEQGKYNKAMEEAIAEDDTKRFYDMKDTAGFKHIATALRYGRLNEHINKLEDQKNQLTAEDIKESYNMSKEDFDQMIDVSVERAKSIQRMYKVAQEKYKNPYNKNKYKYNSDEYKIAQANEKAWDDAIEDMVYNQHSFNRSLDRINSILNETKNISGLNNTALSDFNILFSLSETLETIGSLKKEVKFLKDNTTTHTPESKKVLKEREKRIKHLEEFADAIADAKDELNTEELSTKKRRAISKAYKKYIKHMGNQNADYVVTDSVEKSLNSLLDYHMLKGRSLRINKSINTIMNPQGFKHAVNRTKEINDLIFANKKEEIKSSLLKYRDMKSDNKLLNALYEAGVFFDPKEFKEFKKTGRIPDSFFLIDNVEGNKDELLIGSDKYKEVIGIIKEHIDDLSVELKDLHNFNIEQSRTTAYTSYTRLKSDKDKRTYADLAKQYFEEDNEVRLSVILEKIIKSKFSNKREKELAKELLKIADPNEKITFVNESAAPASYNATEQTIIDARYSANEFKLGKAGAPIESIILHAEILRRTAESLNPDNKEHYDKEYSREMSMLRMLAKSNFEQLSREERDSILTEDVDSISFIGALHSSEDFVSAAMNNPKFQKFLATIEVKRVDESTKKPIWEKFVDAVMKNMERLLGGTPSNTALNAVLTLTTLKMDTVLNGPQEETKNPTKEHGSPGTGIDRNTSYAVISKNHKVLLQALIDAVRKHNAELVAKGEYPIIKKMDELSDSELSKKDKFIDHIKSVDNSYLDDVYDNYNNSNEKQKQPEKTIKEPVEKQEPEKLIGNKSELMAIGRKREKSATSLTSAEKALYEKNKKFIDNYIKERNSLPSVIDRAMKTALRNLGYSYKKMKSIKAAYDIITAGIHKNDVKATQEAEAIKKETEKSNKSLQLEKEIINLIETMDMTKADYEATEMAVMALISENIEYFAESGLTSEDIETLLKEKLDSLEKDVNFDTLEINDMVLLEDRAKTEAIVTDKTDNTLVLVERESGKEFTMNAADVNNRVNVKYESNVSMEETTQTENKNTVTPQAEKEAKESTEAYENINTTEAIKADYEASKNKTADEAEDDFLNNIC